MSKQQTGAVSSEAKRIKFTDPMVDPERVQRLEKSLRAAEAEQARLKQQLNALQTEPSGDRPYHSFAEKTMRGYVMLCMRSRYALEHEEVKGQRLLFEERMTKLTDTVEAFVRETLEDFGYSMESVDKQKLYETFCNSKRKDTDAE